jgi:hypothetical protein
VRAVATIHRDIDSLRAEVAMESTVGAGTASPGGRAPSPAQSSAAGAV